MITRFANYTRTGRKFVVLDDQGRDSLNRRVWTGAVGEANIPDPVSGFWLPYRRDGGRVEFHNGALEFLPTGQALTARGRAGGVQQIFVEERRGRTWAPLPHGLPVRADQDGHRSVQTLTYPDAVGYELEQIYTTGARNRSVVRIRVRSTSTRTVRVILRATGIQNVTPISVSSVARGLPERVVGVRNADMAWRWTYDEAGEREIDIQPGVVSVTLGPYDLRPGEWLDITPDAFGEVAANSDDADQTDGTLDVDGWDSFNINYQASANYGPSYSGWRWTPDLDTTTGVDSIDAGTQILFPNAGSNSTPTSVTSNLDTDDAADAPTFATGANDIDSRTESGDDNTSLTGSAGDQTITTAIINMVDNLVITDGNDYNGTEGMAFIARVTSGDTGNDWWSISYDSSNASTGAQLTIEWTATSGGTNTTPGAGSLTLTGYTPTSTATANESAAPDAGALTLTGNAPTVATTANRTITPAVGSLTLTGNTPTVTVTLNQVASPAVGSLTLTGNTPTVAVSANQIVSPGVGALTLTGYAPSVGNSFNITPAVGALTLTGNTPTITRTDNRDITPAVGSLTLTGNTPTVAATDNHITAPGAANLTLTGVAPTVTVPTDRDITIPVALLALTGYAPTAVTTGLAERKGGAGGARRARRRRKLVLGGIRYVVTSIAEEQAILEAYLEEQEEVLEEATPAQARGVRISLTKVRNRLAAVEAEMRQRRRREEEDILTLLMLG